MGVLHFRWIVYLLLVSMIHHNGATVDEVCDTLTAELIVILDNSGSVGDSNYELEKDFVVALFNELTISPSEVRVGVIDYSTQVNGQTFGFFDSDFDTNAEVINEVEDFNYIGGFTRTDLALTEANDMFDSAPVRVGVPKVVVIITDGQTNNGGKELLDGVVDDLKAEHDVKIIAVGVGDYDIFELNYIASDQSLIFEVDDFDALDEIVDEVLITVCTPLPPAHVMK